MSDPSAPLIVPSPGEIATDEYEIKRSRFITWITRADSEEEARDILALARAEYSDARHHCSAYIHEVEGSNRVERSSDDGEPSGTAGRPMLDVLIGSGMTNVVAVVVRYFGGIKLGTGGLVRAYSDAVSGCLPKVSKNTRVRRELRNIEVNPGDAGRVESELRNRGFDVVDTAWSAQVTHTVAIEPGTTELLDGALQALSHGELLSAKAGTHWVELPLR